MGVGIGLETGRRVLLKPGAIGVSGAIIDGHPFRDALGAVAGEVGGTGAVCRGSGPGSTEVCSARGC